MNNIPSKYILTSILIIIISGFYLINTGEKSLSNIKNYPSSGFQIIAYGDSLVEGVGSTNEGDFVSLLSKKINTPIINLGISGNTTEDGLKRINQLDNFNPKVIILLLGGNDFLKNIPEEDTKKNFESIIENMQNRGSIVYLVGIKGGVFDDKYEKMFNYLEDKYNTAYSKDILDGIIGDNRYMYDPIHPNNEGYEKMANKLYPTLLKLIN